MEVYYKRHNRPAQASDAQRESLPFWLWYAVHLSANVLSTRNRLYNHSAHHVAQFISMSLNYSINLKHMQHVNIILHFNMLPFI
jgi:hypothetical protein